MQALLLISHGSRSEAANLENQRLAELLREKTGTSVVEYAFLEIARPSIDEAVEKCVEQGAGEIIVLLNFLNSGRHVTEDVPRMIEEAKTRHPKVKFCITPPVGQHSNFPDLFMEWIPKQ